VNISDEQIIAAVVESEIGSGILGTPESRIDDAETRG